MPQSRLQTFGPAMRHGGAQLHAAGFVAGFDRLDVEQRRIDAVHAGAGHQSKIESHCVSAGARTALFNACSKGALVRSKSARRLGSMGPASGSLTFCGSTKRPFM